MTMRRLSKKGFNLEPPSLKRKTQSRGRFSMPFLGQKTEIPGRLNPVKVNQYLQELALVKREVAKIVVGQEKIIDSLIMGLLADGNILVEGIPGIAKTLTIRALAKVIGCEFKRIQFTVDLLPTDITGITAFDKQKGFYVVKGPIFAHFVLADEINRAPPKVQSAMLEAMGERQTTIGKETFPMMTPFFVMATENPIEVSGTYPLPEAQIDRFLFKLFMLYPNRDEEQRILKQNIQLKKFDDYEVKPVIGPESIIEMQEATKQVFIEPDIEAYIIKIVEATRYPDKYKISLGKYIEWGGSPRASIGLYIASKAKALMSGRNYVVPQDVKDISYDVLRHRTLLNYEGLADKVKPDDIIKEILTKIPVP